MESALNSPCFPAGSSVHFPQLGLWRCVSGRQETESESRALGKRPFLASASPHTTQLQSRAPSCQRSPRPGVSEPREGGVRTRPHAHPVPFLRRPSDFMLCKLFVVHR